MRFSSLCVTVVIFRAAVKFTQMRTAGETRGAVLARPPGENRATRATALSALQPPAPETRESQGCTPRELKKRGAASEGCGGRLTPRTPGRLRAGCHGEIQGRGHLSRGSCPRVQTAKDPGGRAPAAHPTADASPGQRRPGVNVVRGSRLAAAWPRPVQSPSKGAPSRLPAAHQAPPRAHSGAAALCGWPSPNSLPGAQEPWLSTSHHSCTPRAAAAEEAHAGVTRQGPVRPAGPTWKAGTLVGGVPGGAAGAPVLAG